MGIVDVHGHVTHPDLFKQLPMPPSLADIDGMLAERAEAGIETTIVGSPVGFGTMIPIPGRDNFDQPLDQLRAFHDWLAETVAAHPGQLLAYAYTNPFGGDACLEEAARALREDAFVGLIVNSSVRGEYLDSPAADDFFAMAAELDVPILLHPPAEPVGSSAVRDFRLVEQAVRFLDVTMGLATIVFAGRLERWPGLKLIGATAGGAIGLLAPRLDAAWAGRGERPTPKPPSAYLASVYVDTASTSGPNHLANLELVGAERMLFGSDSPPLPMPLTERIAAVDALGLAEDDREAVLGGNARRLFGLD